MMGTFDPGVSEANKDLGFSFDQMKQNIDQAISAGHDDLIIISEYNPAIEKFKTGHMILDLF